MNHSRMISPRSFTVLWMAISAICFLTAPTLAQQVDTNAYAGLKWRLVGPHRAGRVTAVAGIPGKPGIYYIGTPGGGVWKTTTGGRVWQPIFDDAKVASIGALALAPSNPDIIYVGTGEQTVGDGIYKSADAGKTWTNIGLRETHYITSIIVDPRDPNTLLVAAIGDPVAGPNRGVYKTTDGGRTWSKVLFRDDRTPVMDMCAAPSDSNILFAATATIPSNLPLGGRVQNSLIYKSVDKGATWQEVKGTGLPDTLRGRIGIVVGPGAGGKRVYAIMSQGFFRSDDGGETWQQITQDPRVVGSGYFSRAFVDPKNADIVYVMQTAMYRSVDGGKTFEAFKGAPSGEDEHVLWIAPEDSERMILGTDQGAVVSLDGGRNWTSWYNQPTGQLYHVISDNAFPYRLYASQQDSGSVVVPSRSDFGQISFRDWFSSGAFESGYIAPDPVNPNLIYSIGWFGTVLRLDRSNNQISTVFVPGPNYRYTWETPLVFSPIDHKTLYVGMQNVLKTTDGAVTWQEISPDLTAKLASPESKMDHADDFDDEDEVGRQSGAGRGVIQTIEPSPVKAGEIWVGTSSGLVQLTMDGGASWTNVTPHDMPERGQVILIEASLTDAGTAYAVVNVRLDTHPYIFRTRDGGKTWQKIVNGLPDSAIARVIREDPIRKGLMYAGTEAGAYVSFNNGDAWQPLQLNLPTTSVRDLTVHGNDLVAATYGRGIWILDDVSPLRQLDTPINAKDAKLFRPGDAMRVRWDNWQETPLPADTAAGENPPDGAIIYYYLNRDSSSEVSLEIRDDKGQTVRRYSSLAPKDDGLPGNAPDYWFAPPAVLSATAGIHRFVWDLRWDDPATLPYSYYGKHLDYIEYTVPDNSIAGKTPRHQPPGPLAIPGNYEARLTVNGHTYTQPFVVALDPRVKTPLSDLAAQLDVARQISEAMSTSYNGYNEVSALRGAVSDRLKQIKAKSEAGEANDAVLALQKELDSVQDGTDAAPGFGPINRDLARYFTMIESGDLRPAQSAVNNAAIQRQALDNDTAKWRTIKTERVPELNKILAKFQFAPLPMASGSEMAMKP